MSETDPEMPDGPVLVSACLLGLCTRYQGGHRRREEAVRLLETHNVVPICPEQMGGLSTPRPPAEIDQGDGDTVLAGQARVINDARTDVTEQYLRGARTAAEIAAMVGARRAVLKEGSPACGVHRIKRRGDDVAGSGVAAALLRSKGIQVDGIE
jgi:uncharacterized protein YbbK (DUF523 family)